jgi:hypothetical protein
MRESPYLKWWKDLPSSPNFELAHESKQSFSERKSCHRPAIAFL